MDQGAAMAAGGKVFLIARLAQRYISAAGIVLFPDPIAAMAADQGPLLQAVGTELQIVKQVQRLRRMRLAAQTAGSLSFHSNYLHDVCPGRSGVIHGDNM